MSAAIPGGQAKPTPGNRCAHPGAWGVFMSQRWRPFWQLVLARFREFYREPGALFWVSGSPLLRAVGRGAAFSGGKPAPPKVDVEAGPGAEAIADRLKADKLPAEVHPK